MVKDQGFYLSDSILFFQYMQAEVKFQFGQTG